MLILICEWQTILKCNHGEILNIKVYEEFGDGETHEYPNLKHLISIEDTC